MSVESNLLTSAATTSSYGVTILIDSISNTSVTAAPTANAVNTLNNATTKIATLTAKGDIYVASAASTPTNLAVGGKLQSLIPDSTTTTGLRWANDLLIIDVMQAI
jgi:hypothetical protein